ncbi:hypothetical protein BsWGS_04950 [Bradybaena similaris]
MSVLRRRNKNDAFTEYTCSIRFLDDSETTLLTFKKDTLGHWLFDRVCEKLNLVEKDYFGLRYVDTENQRHWLDPLKTVYKQLKGLSKMVLCFRVKFYPEDPMKLHEEITRYYLFLQLRRDLHHGRLLCSPEESIQLAAYIIQSEVGDYDPQDHPIGYVSSFRMLPKQTPRLEEKITEAHKALAGKVPSECEASFLKKAASMDTYGVDPHQVKDQKGDPLYLGVTHLGAMTFRGNRRTQLFQWNQIKRIAYEGKVFIINYSNSEDDSSGSKKKHHAVGYKCTTAAAAKYLWRCSVEQQLFFTLSSSAAAPKVRSGGSLFSRGSKFRFSGRCQNEAYEASGNIRRAEPPFARTSSLPNFAKKNHSFDKNNTTRSSLASSSFREEAAVDVPSVVSKVARPASKEQSVEEELQVQAPLAQIEAFEEKLQQTATVEVLAAAPAPPPSPPPAARPPSTEIRVENLVMDAPLTASSPLKENGQVVRNMPGILETSLDDFIPYEPNQTFEEYDTEKEKEEEEQEEYPCLDDEIQKLEEDIIQPIVKENLSSAPQTLPASEPCVDKNEESRSCVGVLVKAVALSLVFALFLSMIMFYVVFLSPLEHPLIFTARDRLHFLEPVSQFVQQKAVQYFHK